MSDTVTQENGGKNGAWGWVDTSLKTIESVSETVTPLWSSYVQAKQQKDQLDNTTYAGDPDSANLNTPTTGNARQSDTDDNTMLYIGVGGAVVAGALLLYLVAK